jgi:hypothetical protein
VQDACEAVAAALLKRMNRMSKMHIAAVIISLLFGQQDSTQNSATGLMSNLMHSETPCKAKKHAALGVTPQNLSMLTVVVQKLLYVLQQMGHIDRTLPCSLANVLLNGEMDREKEDAVVTLLSELSCKQEVAASIATTLGHASKRNLEHLQQSTVTKLETLCSMGLAAGAHGLYSS